MGRDTTIHAGEESTSKHLTGRTNVNLTLSRMQLAPIILLATYNMTALSGSQRARSQMAKIDQLIRNLVKAGALIAAEIDRLQRAALSGEGDK